MTSPTSRSLPLNRAALARTLDDPRPWFRISNATAADTGPARVDLYGTIGESWWGDGNTAADFVRAINELDVDEIQLHINSGGGDVYEGIAILNGLRQHKARVVVTVDGLAASAASFIAMGGDEVVMAANSEMMIHDAWGMAMGNAADMRKYADDLDRISGNIASIYADHAGGEAQTFRDLMLAETWFSAAEAVDAGLADRVEKSKDGGDAKKDALSRTVLAFAHAGRSHAPAPQFSTAASASVATPPHGRSSSGDTTQEGASAVEITDEQMTTLRQTAGVADDADLETCLAAIGEALEERADDAAASSTTTAAASARVPEGMVLMDASVQANLLADASAGRAAREQQQTERRQAIVSAAVRDGRIAPARRDAWLNTLAADPGAEETLAQLAPGLVPVNELGHGAHDERVHSEDDSLYDMAWGSPARKDG